MSLVKMIEILFFYLNTICYYSCYNKSYLQNVIILSPFKISQGLKAKIVKEILNFL